MLPYSAFKVVMMGSRSIFLTMSTIPYTLTKWIITVPCMGPCFLPLYFYLCFFCWNTLLPSKSHPLFKVLLLKWPSSLEMFHDLFSATFIAPSFLFHISTLLSNYFGISIISLLRCKKRGVFYAWFHSPLPYHN